MDYLVWFGNICFLGINQFGIRMFNYLWDFVSVEQESNSYHGDCLLKVKKFCHFNIARKTNYMNK